MPTATSPITIRYGQQRIPVPAPEGATVRVVGRRAGEGRADRDVLAGAFAKPLKAPTIDNFLLGASAPLVIVNDATRSTPTAAMLDFIIPALQNFATWRVIVATGLHRAPSDGELEAIFGRHLQTVKEHLLIHNGYDHGCLAAVESPVGTLLLNRVVLESDRLILLNSVEPHFFAGYTGGRKSIIPGLAGHDTVQASHAGAVSTDSAPLRVTGNPVRDFIHRSTEAFAGEICWAVQVVLDREDRIAAAFAGDIDAAFDAATAGADRYYVVSLDQQFDILVAAIHPPLDLNLYQAEKGWELTQTGVRDGGVLILTSPCIEGVGSPFYQRLSEDFPKPKEWLALATRPYTMGLHKLVRTGRALSRMRLIAVTDMAPEIVARFGYDVVPTLAEAIQMAIAQVGTLPSVLIVEDAALTTLMIRNT